MLLLAQIDAGAIEVWLKVLFFLLAGLGSFLGCLVAIKGLRSRGLPQPLEIRNQQTFATTQEVGALKEDVEQLRSEVKDGFDKLGNERRTSVANLHSKVDEANRKVDEMRGELRLINQQQHQILQKILKS